MKRIDIRLNDDLNQQIKTESKLRGLSQTDLIVRALDHFLTCRKAEKEPSLIPIINAYENVFCSYCTSQIPRGQRCLWGKDEKAKTIYVCSECEVNETETDQTIVIRVIKKRILERQIRALQNQLDQLASKFEASELFNKEQEVLKLLSTMHKCFMELSSTIEYNRAIKGSLSVDQLEKNIDELIEFSRKCMTYLQDFDSFREKYLKVKATQKEKVKA